MSMEVRYEAGVSATYEDITDRVRTFQLDVTQNAEEGSVALSTIVIDDPDGDYEIKGYRRIAVYETEGEEDVSQLTYNGFIVDRRIIRGPNRTGAGRQWVCSVVDTNCLLEFRIMTGSDANRPAETDIERMDWLLAESEMDRIPNHTYYNTTGPVAMDAADYRGQRAVDIINDCAQQSGKNYFAICVDATAAPIPAAPGATTFWYDFADSTAYTSELTLSNDLADVLADPGVCYEISLDTELARDPNRVYSGAYVRYDGGDVFEEDLGISAEFTRRDAVVPADNVKTSAKATARALRYLADMDTEEDRITTSVLIPAAQVNLIREGMRISFKATHLPGYEAFVWERILRRTVKQVTPEYYLLTLTLSGGGLAGCIDCGEAPELVGEYSTTGDGGTGSDFQVQLPWTPQECALQVAVIMTRASSVAAQTGWTLADTAIAGGTANSGEEAMFYRTVPAGAASLLHFNIGVPSRVSVIEITNLDSLDDSVTTPGAINLSASVTSGSLSLTGRRLLVGAVIVSGTGVAGGGSHPIFSIDAPMTEIDNGPCGGDLGPNHAVAYRILDPASGSYDMDVSLTVGGFTNQGEVATILAAFSCEV